MYGVVYVLIFRLCRDGAASFRFGHFYKTVIIIIAIIITFINNHSTNRTATAFWQTMLLRYIGNSILVYARFSRSNRSNEMLHFPPSCSLVWVNARYPVGVWRVKCKCKSYSSADSICNQKYTMQNNKTKYSHSKLIYECSIPTCAKRPRVVRPSFAQLKLDAPTRRHTTIMPKHIRRSFHTVQPYQSNRRICLNSGGFECNPKMCVYLDEKY